jgi:Zn-dependent peptidase ImmA (M78 family)
MTLPRGFKAEAERKSAVIRGQLGLRDFEPVDLFKVATLLDARIVSADKLVSIERLHEIESLQAFAFSACTFEIRAKPVVVFNPLRTTGRRSSDIAHELSHLILKHDLSEIEYLGDIAFRTCRSDQEEQATSLGATLLLPRPLLAYAARRKMTIEEIADEFQVTVEMARFRWNSTGIERQTAFARSKQR